MTKLIKLAWHILKGLLHVRDNLWAELLVNLSKTLNLFLLFFSFFENVV